MSILRTGIDLQHVIVAVDEGSGDFDPIAYLPEIDARFQPSDVFVKKLLNVAKH